FRPEDVTVERQVASDWLVQADGPYVVALDPHLTPDLVQEGLAREVVNRVQRLRKEADYAYTTRIELRIAGAEDVVAATAADGAREAVPVRVAGRPRPLARERGAAPALQVPGEIRQVRAVRRGHRLRPVGRAAARATVHQVQGGGRRWQAALTGGCSG